MRKIFLFAAFFAILSVSAQDYFAGGIRTILEDNIKLAGCNYESYFDVYNSLTKFGFTKQTPAPEGYEPFYISTFARHGSRYLTEAGTYDTPINLLKKAQGKHKLTPQGETLLKELKELRAQCPDSKFGALTEIGAAQHRDIARRMCRNFPEIFDAQGHFFAQSSTSKRCIKSMNAEVEIIDSVTHLKVEQASGRPGMQDRLAGHFNNDRIESWRGKGYKYHNTERAEMIPTERISNLLFTDNSWITSKEQRSLVNCLYYLAGNMQSHNFNIDLWKYFTVDELVAIYTVGNRHFYRMFGPSPTTGNMCPLRATWQCEDIMEGADSVVNRRNWHGGNFRFSHDTSLMPLACLLELGTCGKQVPEDSIGTIDTFFRSHEIFCKAGNIQLVFYRPKNGQGDILVKAMLCEREVTLPGHAVVGPYYRWTEIEEHWKKSLKRATE